MADISKIKVPNGTVYDLKDETARQAAGNALADCLVSCGGSTEDSIDVNETKFEDFYSIGFKNGNGTTVANIDYNDTYYRYGNASTSKAGLMSVSDKKNLDILTQPYAVCATGRGTAAKAATLTNFSLNVGATIAVKFTDTAGTANPASGNLTLNVNNTGAKNIGYFRNGGKAALTYSSGGYFYNNLTHIFTYDGTYWLCMDWNADNNTWRGIQNNLTSDSTSDSLSAAQGKALKALVDGKAAESHTHAMSDITDLPAISNPNLLINPDFRINQRGLTTYTGAVQYTVDMWSQYPAASVVTVVDDGIRLSSSNSNNYADIHYKFEHYLSANEDYSFTINIDNVEYKMVCNMKSDGSYSSFAIADNAIRVYLAYSDIIIRLMAGYDGVLIKYVKIEKGSVSTPFFPPEPITELLKCQRYYQIRSSNNIAAVDLRPNMREGVTPTISALGNGNYSYSAEL